MMEFWANPTGKNHTFQLNFPFSTCGWMFRGEAIECSKDDFIKNPCGACFSNFTAKGKWKNCGKCGFVHRHLNDIQYDERITILRKVGSTHCALCDFPLAFMVGLSHAIRPSADHIVEAKNNGCSHPNNYQLTHAWCNHARSSGFPTRELLLNHFNFERKIIRPLQDRLLLPREDLTIAV